MEERENKMEEKENNIEETVVLSAKSYMYKLIGLLIIILDIIQVFILLDAFGGFDNLIEYAPLLILEVVVFLILGIFVMIFNYEIVVTDKRVAAALFFYHFQLEEKTLKTKSISFVEKGMLKSISIRTSSGGIHSILIDKNDILYDTISELIKSLD